MSVSPPTILVPLALFALWLAFGLVAVIAAAALADLALRRVEARAPRRATIPARSDERR